MSVAISETSSLIEAVRAGEMVILVDDEDQENEGDVIAAADCLTNEQVAFMARECCGLICMPLPGSVCDRLQFGPMTARNEAHHGTAFTVTIESREGVTTGISAADRAYTMREVMNDDATPDQFVRPGHVFPLRAADGGVLRRAGHTEAAIDLAVLAGRKPGAAIVEIMNEDGTMARLPELREFALKFGLKIGTIADLIHYRQSRENTLTTISEKTITTRHGDWKVHTYLDSISGDHHHAMVYGDIPEDGSTMVRVQRIELERDALGLMTDDSWSVDTAQERIARHGHGVVALLGGAWASRDSRSGSSSHTMRDVGLGAQILQNVGVHSCVALGSPLPQSPLSWFDINIINFESPKGRSS